MCPVDGDALDEDMKDGEAVNITELDTGTKESVAADSGASEEAAAERETPKEGSARGQRRISISLRTLALVSIVVGLIGAVAVMTWLYVGTNTKLDAQAQQARDETHAEQIALDYAVRAAIMNHQDLGPWKKALVEGTTPELTKKLSEAANAMEQILLPLQWTSTAKPLAAKVRSHEDGVYVVDAFVGVMTKTVQAAESLQSTATYSVTVDPANGWKISDVGGIAQIVGDK